MAIRLYNTRTKEKEPFEKHLGETVGMYNCGPTVYDYVHIGNLRSYVFSDTVRRMLEAGGYNVDQVMNLTDIGHLKSDADSGEDKMMIALKREGKPLTLEAMKEVAVFYGERFVEDLKALNILMPTHLEYASDHVAEDIALIERLVAKGYTYATSDGLYFDTSKDTSYGALGGLSKESTETESRIGENSEKKNQRDFALWKNNDALGYDTPWGKGFPGWHIECSAMSMHYLGETFDIHTGGIDHIPIHHNNEIAQSECATGKPFAKIWMHNAFVTIRDEKIAKSLGNGIRLRDLAEKGWNPLAYRLWLLTAHYRREVSFSEEALEASHTRLSRLYEAFDALSLDDDTVDAATVESVRSCMENDLDTPTALTYLETTLKNIELPEAVRRATILAIDQYFGLGFEDRTALVLSPQVAALIEKREQARAEKAFTESDALREEIEALGFIVKDTDQGPRITKK